MKKDIYKVLEGFRKVNLLKGNPRYTEEEITNFEKSVGYKLPEDYKIVLRAGYIDKGNFHFVTPRRFEYDESMIVFGTWNKDIFMFNTKEGDGDYTVYVTVGEDDKTPEKRFNNFADWFDSVLHSVGPTNYPE